LKKCIRFVQEMYFLIAWFYYLSRSAIKEHMRGSKRRITSFKEKFVIVGNGPSAGDFDFLEAERHGYSIICVNGFAAQNQDFFEIKPKYYCIVDDRYFEKDSEYNFVKELREALEKVDWDLQIILLGRHTFNIDNERIKYVYLNDNIYKGTYFRLSLLKNNLATDGYQNVIHAALYFAITAKAEEVILIGVENDWHRELVVDENNNVYREYRHFYAEEKALVTGIQIEKGELYKYFYWYYLTLKRYQQLSEYAEWNGVRVYNATPNSYVDVYERKNVSYFLSQS